MNLLALANLRFGAAAALVSMSLACSSSSSTSTTDHETGHDAGDTGHDASHDSPRAVDDAISCGAVGILPAIVFVTSAVTGEQICDAVIAEVPDGGIASGDAGPSIGYPCATDNAGCPSSPPDGGKETCVFAVGNSLDFDATILVSAPGYASKTVSNVSVGITGCVSEPTPGTQVHVELVPLVDSGTAPDAS